MTLEALALEEDEIDRIVQGCTGHIEVKLSQLAAAGVPDRYAKIHAAYLSLPGSTALRREALKRALFIGWYSLTEPSAFSGIFDIPLDQFRQTFVSLDILLSVDGGDEELDWMLPWYHHITDFMLDAVVDPEHRLLAVRSVVGRGVSIQLPEQPPGVLRGRGAMGRYWTSILGAGSASA